MPHIERLQLKKNKLADIALNVAEWIRVNRSTFLSIAGTVALVIVFAGFFLIRLSSLEKRAEDKFTAGQAMLMQGQPDQGIAVLTEVIAQYPRSEAASRARLTKAEYLFEKKQLDEAEKTILPATESARPKTIVPLAMSVLGTIREDAGKYKEAIELQNAFLSRYPEHYLAPRAYESLARLYELTGRTAEAKTTYEKLAALYPASAWAQRAQERAATLSPGKSPLK